MQLTKQQIELDNGMPTDDNGNSWTTAQEWIELAVSEDKDNEYTAAEWKQLCRVFASEVRILLKSYEDFPA